MNNELDPIIHQTTRLRLMAVLCQLEEGDWVDFTTLKKELGLTDGNLGAQLTKLEDAKYLKIKKEFVDKRPRTKAQPTARGKSALILYRETLRQIIDGDS